MGGDLSSNWWGSVERLATQKKAALMTHTTGMQKIVANSPALAARSEFCNIMNLQATDVIATRLWFDRRVNTKFSANVLGGFEENCGGTFFNLNELQVKCLYIHTTRMYYIHRMLFVCLHNKTRFMLVDVDGMRAQDEYKDEPGSVIAADYYHAGALLPLSDEEIVRRTKSHMSVCEPGFLDAKVVDAAVLRFPKAVTQFSPGSWRARPFQTTSFNNLFMAGDWCVDTMSFRIMCDRLCCFWHQRYN